jgi:hypothetical protein
VFVSSTFTDLVEERQQALQAILTLGHFPTGMEIFPAAGTAPWDLIARVIKDSDYYVLIMAARYGSLTGEGISFTEREYDEAIQLGKFVLPFLHADPEELPRRNHERDPEAEKRLEAFRAKVRAAHTCNMWKDGPDLALKITQSLLNAFNSHPSEGWVRSGGPDVVKLLTEINDLRQRMESVEAEKRDLQAQLSGTLKTREFDPDEPVTVRIQLVSGLVEASVTWMEVFLGAAPSLLGGTYEYNVQVALGEYLDSPEHRGSHKKLGGATQVLMAANACVIDDDLDRIFRGLLARGLVEPEPAREGKKCWALTREGTRLFLDLRGD